MPGLRERPSVRDPCARDLPSAWSRSSAPWSSACCPHACLDSPFSLASYTCGWSRNRCPGTRTIRARLESSQPNGTAAREEEEKYLREYARKAYRLRPRSQRLWKRLDLC